MQFNILYYNVHTHSECKDVNILNIFSLLSTYYNVFTIDFPNSLKRTCNSSNGFSKGNFVAQSSVSSILNIIYSYIINIWAVGFEMSSIFHYILTLYESKSIINTKWIRYTCREHPKSDTRENLPLYTTNKFNKISWELISFNIHVDVITFAWWKRFH